VVGYGGGAAGLGDAEGGVFKPKEKMYSTEGAKASQADWAERGSSSLWGGAGRHGQTRASQAGPLEELKWKLILTVSHLLCRIQNSDWPLGV
jgi:hypothetical protein